MLVTDRQQTNPGLIFAFRFAGVSGQRACVRTIDVAK